VTPKAPTAYPSATPSPARRRSLMPTSITVGEIAMVIIAIFVILAYFHGWG
jgi:hypothetical protein